VMKKSIAIISAVTAILLLWPSCTQVEETGKLQFGLELSDDSTLKSAVDGYNVTAALVTIISETGALIYEKEYLPIYRFGNQYTTKSVELPMGEYQLSEFMLIDSSGVVLWATPREGSELAHLVRHPLPIPFGISPEATTSLDIQVIRVKDHPPADFGYLNFNIGFVDRFCLKVFYSSRCLEEWNDSILSPAGSETPVVGSGAPVFQPRLTIWFEDRMLVNEPLVPGLNRYAVPMVAEWYRLTATDCHGQVIYEARLPLRELLQHRCLDNHPPLLIYRDPIPGIIITPEGLQEPTIRQGVFGNITLPVDDTLNTENYDVYPVIRDVYFYPYSVTDSIQTFAPIDCYFPAEALGMDPVAIVRSNSDGYFQVPLREGEYLYLVKDGDRYYMDSYVSSHPPGFVKVYPEEVTKLLIHVVDCSMWM
ncbi:MAG: hypothetical protein ABFS38_20090, partial [Bacteroidota bacterium]